MITCPNCHRLCRITDTQVNLGGDIVKITAECKKCGTVKPYYDYYEEVVKRRGG